MSTVENFQAASSRQGEEFHQACRFLLLAERWIITAEKVKVAGVEIDIIATNPDGQRWWIECKGSNRGSVPGSKRGDTAKKAVAVAAYLSVQPDRLPYLLLTSHYPTDGTVAYRLLETALEQSWFTDIRVVGLRHRADDLVDDDE